MLITDIHREVFQVLHEKHLQDPEFRFTLRGSNNNDRLAKGYWFSGNDYSIYFSFWGGSDTANKTPNVYFVINVDGITHLNFVAKDSDKKAAFFEKLALLLDMKRTKHQGMYVNHWRKYYNAEASDDRSVYLSSLEEFLTKDKPKIDLFIQLENNRDLMPPINDYFFAKNVEQIEKFRYDIKAQEESGLVEPKSQPIRLRSIQLYNIGHFENIEIPLHHRLTCLVGDNSCGKSTVLRAIALGLGGIAPGGWLNKEDDKIQKMLRIVNEYNGKCTYSPTGKISLTYNMGEDYTNEILFRDELKVDRFGVSRAYVNVIDGDHSDLASVENTSFFRNTLVLGFTQLKGRLPLQDHRPAHFSRRSREHDAFKRSNLNDVMPLIYDQPDYRYAHFVSWLAHFLDQAKSTPTEVLKMRRLLEKTILPFLSRISGQEITFRHLNFETKEIFVTTENAPNGIALSALGQGLCGVLGYIGYFAKRLWETHSTMNDCTQAHSLLIIDEIDSHLHPKLQSRILDALLDFFPNTQFIVTTQSPIAIAHVEHFNDLGVYEISNQQVMPLRSAGQHISTLLWHGFGVADRARFAQEALDKLFEALSDESVAREDIIEKLEQLKQLLGDDDPDVMYATNQVEEHAAMEQDV